MTRTKPRDLPTLAQQLVTEAAAHGLEPRLILAPAALGVLLLGLGPRYGAALELTANQPSPTAALHRALAASAEEFTYLEGHLHSLTSTPADPLVDRVTAAMLRTLAAADLLALAESPLVAGDLLGPLYTHVMAPADRKARGAFYTPPALAQVLAGITGLPRPGEAFCDPCSGTGGLAIAAVRAMRASGGAPELVRWDLQDIDGLALALAGVQLAAHGIPHVTLTHGNALATQAAS